MRLPVVDRLSRVPVPGFVRAAATPAIETVTSYAVTAGHLLDQLVTEAIAEVVRRVDLDATIARVDLDAVVQRVDIEAVLDRIDLTDTVLTRVDLDALVSQVMTRVDEKDIAALASKVDVDTVARRLDIEAVLDRMDLTSTVLKRVDLVKVVDAVLDQMDLIALANEIIDGVDLPEIIRDSTGSMASETVKGVRMQGIGADQAVDRALDRLLLRRSRSNGTAGS
jgi:hypothetical protein